MYRLEQPRTEANTLFGYGMSNDGFNENPSQFPAGWRPAVQGLMGDVLDGLVLLSLLIIATPLAQHRSAEPSLSFY